MTRDPAAWRRLLREDRVLSMGEMFAGLAHQLNNPLAGVKLVEHLPDGCPAIAGNPTRLDLALEHLVNNAIDAVSEFRGSGTVELTASPDGDAVQIDVQDDGGGMGTLAPSTPAPTVARPGSSRPSARPTQTAHVAGASRPASGRARSAGGPTGTGRT